MDFLTIVKKPNWQAPYYLVDGKGKRVKFSDTVVVQWPNGSISTEVRSYKDFSETCSEMGHSYSYSSRIIGVNADVNGIKTFVPIYRLKVREDCVIR